MKLAKQGLVGLCQVWFSTLFDWITTVPEQHLEEVLQMSGQKRLIQLGALAALVGGVLGLLLLTQGPNSYGNYGWHGWLAPLPPILFILGLGGAIAANQITLTPLGKVGLYIIIGGLVLMGIGHIIGLLWSFIFIGPMIIMPIGAIMLGLSIYQYLSLPMWWRFFPFIIFAIAVLGFSIEMIEEFSGNSTPDRGIQTVEALFSTAWIGLGEKLDLMILDLQHNCFLLRQQVDLFTRLVDYVERNTSSACSFQSRTESRKYPSITTEITQRIPDTVV
jgi:MFS family permease